nr:MAG TPA: hypothetical protein [Caudoviricetes sp.]
MRRGGILNIRFVFFSAFSNSQGVLGQYVSVAR